VDGFLHLSFQDTTETAVRAYYTCPRLIPSPYLVMSNQCKRWLLSNEKRVPLFHSFGVIERNLVQCAQAEHLRNIFEISEIFTTRITGFPGWGSRALRACCACVPPTHASTKSMHGKGGRLKEGAQPHLEFTSNAQVHTSHLIILTRPIWYPIVMHTLKNVGPLFQDAEARHSELIARVPDSTRPLLRQIEALQEAASSRAEAWAAVERTLNARVQEAEVAAAGAQERERAAGERMTQAASRMAVMEAQVGVHQSIETALKVILALWVCFPPSSYLLTAIVTSGQTLKIHSFFF
jgi:hypothetical protein